MISAYLDAVRRSVENIFEPSPGRDDALAKLDEVERILSNVPIRRPDCGVHGCRESADFIDSDQQTILFRCRGHKEKPL